MAGVPPKSSVFSSAPLCLMTHTLHSLDRRGVKEEGDPCRGRGSSDGLTALSETLMLPQELHRISS